MRKLVAAVLLVVSGLAWGKSHVVGIKVAVTNPSHEERIASDVVIPMAALRKIAPSIDASSLIVTATNASTAEQDAVELQAEELPSQADDLDADGVADELAFQIDLKPGQTRIATISFGPPDRIARLRRDNPATVAAVWDPIKKTVGWESEQVGWHYSLADNRLSIIGKRRPALLLQRTAAPEYDVRAENPGGHEIAVLGAVAASSGGVTTSLDSCSRTAHAISSGPVRAIVEIRNERCVAGDVAYRITQWTGERGFTAEALGRNPVSFPFGFEALENSSNQVSPPQSRQLRFAWWGYLDRSSSSPSQLGIAVIGDSSASVTEENPQAFRISIPAGSKLYVIAAWNKEGTNNRSGFGAQKEEREDASRVLPQTGAITSKGQFFEFVTRAVIGAPAFSIFSTAATPQSAPPDTLVSAERKTYKTAIELLRAEIDRTATKWEPILSATGPANMTANSGAGFFTDGDNVTGEWQPRKGYFWTGGFWTGELWKMYARTRHEKYKRWAQLWTSALLNKEGTQNHDIGFLQYYSAVAGYELTKDPALRESALRGAGRLKQLFSPATNLIASWNVNGDDTIVDTMMNLQLLWWASRETGDPQWKEIAIKHALRTAEWLVRPDGSVIQSVHYNPGDNRQSVKSHATGPDVEVKVPNTARPGEIVFTHTHQGFDAGTSWSRGAAWALYSFPVAHKETNDPRMLATAEKVADFVLANLPDDGVPWYDFYDEGVLFRNRDTSAAALIAGGMLKLSDVETDGEKAKRYRKESERIAQSLIDHYLTPIGDDSTTPPGVLRHGCGTRPQDGTLIYGQYYLLETLMALEEHGAVAK